MRQLGVLLWKHWTTRKRSLEQNVQLFVLPITSLTLCCLFYFTFNPPDRNSTGWLELIFVPLAVFQLMNIEVINLVNEKATRLLELMRIMSLRVESYYVAHAIESVLLGLVSAIVLASVATGEGLFNGGAWVYIFGLLWGFNVAATAFAFALAACCDSPQTAGQVALAAQGAQVIIFFTVIGDDPNASTNSEKYEERTYCLLPVIGLELGTNSFRGPPTQSRRQYSGIGFGQILAILVASAAVYVVLAAYLTQVIPSEFSAGAVKPWYFPLLPPSSVESKENDQEEDQEEEDEDYVVREEGRNVTEATVVVRRLRKQFGENVVVRIAELNLYEDQIFALLGHNGPYTRVRSRAGKSTTLNMLTGVLESDSTAPDGGATILGHAIRSQMDEVRKIIGMCAQHDILFDLLTCREHLTFFARIKGVNQDEADSEADDLLEKFNLLHRADSKAHELSGGMRRKLSCAIALCGRSKCIFLDEPTAGLDTLARRELWDLMLTIKRGRTVLVSTHYMSEADVLGDVIGIMVKGRLKCVGNSAFLKRQYGGGYRVTCEGLNMDNQGFANLCSTQFGNDARMISTTAVELPHDRVKEFPPFFDALDNAKQRLRIESYGLMLTSIEDVFLKVGANEADQPSKLAARLRIGSGRQFDADSRLQAYALAVKRLQSAKNDIRMLGLLLLPIAAVVCAFALAKRGLLGSNAQTSDTIVAAICAAGFLLYPAFSAQQIVAERELLVHVLRVCGCDGVAYWVGSFIGEYALFFIIVAVYWLVIVTIAPLRWIATTGGSFYVPLSFGVLIITYSHALSHIIYSSSRCITIVSGIQVFQLFTPPLVVLTFYVIIRTFDENFSLDRIEGGQIWVLVILSPQGAFWLAFYNTANNLSFSQGYAPRFYIVMLIQAIEACAYFAATLAVEDRALRPLKRVLPTSGPSDDGDADVLREAALVADMTDEDIMQCRDLEAANEKRQYTLVIKRLRKVYATNNTIAVHDLSLRISQGECFGLLGANGAGKTTTISAVIRAIEPTNGDIFVNGHSVLTDFKKAATFLGVVAQSNTLWDNLTCVDHLELFSRIRGVPNDQAPELVEAALDQLELRPHAYKLAARLSGGMKRKLCVAIAIIGDPQCCLLDEPSAGLDPVSRRNLWNLLRETMSTRSVVLTSHLMDEVEALCDRVAILVGGRARCLGTIQHLISTRGKVFEVSITAADEPDIAKRIVAEVLPAAALEDEHGAFLQYRVPWEDMRIGHTFEAFEKAGAIKDYSISQPSLESVFVRCVKEHADISVVPSTVPATLHMVAESLEEDIGQRRPSQDAFILFGGGDDDIMTGCTRRVHRRIAASTAFIFVCCVIVSGVVKSILLLLASLAALIAFIWALIGIFCASPLEASHPEESSSLTTAAPKSYGTA